MVTLAPGGISYVEIAPAESTAGHMDITVSRESDVIDATLLLLDETAKSGPLDYSAVCSESQLTFVDGVATATVAMNDGCSTHAALILVHGDPIGGAEEGATWSATFWRAVDCEGAHDVFDDFNRVVADGLGTSTSGRPWALQWEFNNDEASVNGSHAVVTGKWQADLGVPGTNMGCWSKYDEPGTIYATGLQLTPSNNGSLGSLLSVGLRQDSVAESNVAAGWSVYPQEEPLVAMELRVRGNTAYVEHPSIGVDPFKPYNMRLEFDGSEARVRFWQVGEPEPQVWHLAESAPPIEPETLDYLFIDSANNAGSFVDEILMPKDD